MVKGHKCPVCGKWIRCPTCNELITSNDLSISTDMNNGIEYCSKECWNKVFNKDGTRKLR